jgi:hypothetical protein
MAFREPATAPEDTEITTEGTEDMESRGEDKEKKESIQR